MVEAAVRGLLLRGSALRVVLLGSNIAVGFYLMPFLIHSLGDRWYGMWTLVATVMGYYGFLDFGLSIAAQRFMARALQARDHQEVNRLVTTSLLVFAAIGSLVLVATGIVAAAAPYFFADPAEVASFRLVVGVLGVSAALNFPLAAFNGLITGNLRYDLVSYLELAKLGLRTSLIVYAIGGGYGIVALAVIVFAMDTAGNLARVWLARRMFRNLRLGPQFYSARALRELFGFGSKSFVNQIAELLRFQLDHVVIAAFVNLSAVTLFNIAGQLVYYFRSLVAALMGVLMPVYARLQVAGEGGERMQKTYLLTSKLAAGVAVFGGGAAVVFGNDFVRLWMGPAYGEAYVLLVILIVPMVLYLTQSPGIGMIYGLGEVGALAKASLVEACANLLLSIALVLPLGLRGVALGTALPLAAFSIFLMRLSCRLVGASVRLYLRQVAPVLVWGILLQAGGGWLMAGSAIESYGQLFGWFLALYPAQIIAVALLTFAPHELQLLGETARRALGRPARAGDA